MMTNFINNHPTRHCVAAAAARPKARRLKALFKDILLLCNAIHKEGGKRPLFEVSRPDALGFRETHE